MARSLLPVAMAIILAAAAPGRGGEIEAREQLHTAIGRAADRQAAADLLIGHLNDPDADVRRVAAAMIFEKTYTPEPTIPQLIKLAETHPDPNVREWLVAALGASTSDTTAAIPALRRVLQSDPNENARANAACALSRIGKQPATVVPALTGALGDASAYVRGEAAMALGMFDHDAASAVAALKALSADPSPYAADRARYAVYRITLPDDPAQAVPILVKALDDPFHEVRSWAAAAAGRIGKPAAPAVPALIKLIKAVDQPRPQAQASDGVDWVEQVGGAATLALGGIGAAPGVVDALDEALTSGSWLVRREAVRALRRLGPDGAAAAPRLAGMLNDESQEVAAWAETALESVGPAGKAAVPFLIDVLHQPDHDRLYGAIRAIGLIGDLGDDAREGIGLVSEIAASHRDPSIRGAAVYAMKRIAAYHPDRCVEPLMMLLDKARWQDRSTVFDALAVIGPPAAAAAPRLLACLQSRDYSQEHRNIAEALGRIHADAPTVVPALITLMQTTRGRLRARIAFALGMYGPDAQAALPALREMAEAGHFDVERRYAAEAVRRIAPQQAQVSRD